MYVLRICLEEHICLESTSWHISIHTFKTYVTGRYVLKNIYVLRICLDIFQYIPSRHIYLADMSWRTHMSWGYVLKISTHTFKTYETYFCLICLEDMSWNTQHISSRHIEQYSVSDMSCRYVLNSKTICRESYALQIYREHKQRMSWGYVVRYQRICHEELCVLCVEDMSCVIKVCLEGYHIYVVKVSLERMSWNINQCPEANIYTSWHIWNPLFGMCSGYVLTHQSICRDGLSTICLENMSWIIT